MADKKIVAELPDGTEQEFPAGTTLEKVKAWVKQKLTTGLIPGRKIAEKVMNVPGSPLAGLRDSPTARGVVKGVGGVVEDISSPAALATGGAAMAAGPGFAPFALGAFFAGDALSRAYRDLTGLGDAESTEEAAERATGATLNAASSVLPFVGSRRPVPGRRAPVGAPAAGQPPPSMAPVADAFLGAPEALSSNAGVAAAPSAMPAGAPSQRVPILPRGASFRPPEVAAVGRMLARGVRPDQTPRATPRASQAPPPARPQAPRLPAMTGAPPPVEVAPPVPTIRSVNMPTRGDWAGQRAVPRPPQGPTQWSRTAEEAMAAVPREPIQKMAPLTRDPLTNPPLPPVPEGGVVTGAPLAPPPAKAEPARGAAWQPKKGRQYNPEKHLVNAVLAAGGINPRLVARSGWSGEWNMIPAKIRRMISRKSSGQSFDTVVAELKNKGVWDVDDKMLMEMLRDPKVALRPREFGKADLDAEAAYYAERAAMEAMAEEAGDVSFDFSDESGFARFKNPNQRGLFHEKQDLTEAERAFAAAAGMPVSFGAPADVKAKFPRQTENLPAVIQPREGTVRPYSKMEQAAEKAQVELEKFIGLSKQAVASIDDALRQIAGIEQRHMGVQKTRPMEGAIDIEGSVIPERKALSPAGPSHEDLARAWLKYTGQKGTPKQVQEMMRFDAPTLERMLRQRGAMPKNSMQEVADQFVSGHMRQRETVLRETIGRVLKGTGSWAAKRRQLGLPEAEVPISAPEVESIVKASLAGGGQ